MAHLSPGSLKRLLLNLVHRQDVLLSVLLLVLSLMGLLLVYSATNGDWVVVMRQAVLVGVGFVLMFLISRIRAYTLEQLAYLSLLGTVALMVLTLLIAPDVSGSQRWLPLPFGFTLQVSEIAKLTLPLALAAYLGGSPASDRFTFFNLIGILLVCACVCWLIAAQPDLGTTIIVGIAAMVMLFLFGIRRRLVIMGSVILLLLPALIWPTLELYQKQRIITFLFPGSDPLGAGWNIRQSIIAIGSGGVSGKGYLNGTQSQLDFVPERHTDFIFALLAEELGLIGCLVLLALLGAVVWRVLRMSESMHRDFARLFSATFVIIFAAQGLINIAMVCGLLPVVGLPLPLVSVGGSAKLALFCGFGVIMSLYYESSRQRVGGSRP